MILSGKPIADSLQEEIGKRIKLLSRPPSLTVFLIGSNPASETYVGVKQKACESMGIRSQILRLPESVEEKEVLHLIEKLNHDRECDGILVQFPLPPQLDSKRIVESIDPTKDVDGFHPMNLGKLLLEQEDGFVPCTPFAIKVLLEKAKISVTGKHVVIIGRSLVVGKPLAALLLQNKPGCNATVTVAHRHTQELPALCQQADILVAAVGQPKFITAAMVKKGAVVIDVGINRVQDHRALKGYRIVGDVDFEKVEPKCSAITPVPKGIGPVTVAMLLYNTTLSAERRLAR